MPPFLEEDSVDELAEAPSELKFSSQSPFGALWPSPLERRFLGHHAPNSLSLVTAQSPPELDREPSDLAVDRNSSPVLNGDFSSTPSGLNADSRDTSVLEAPLCHTLAQQDILVSVDLPPSTLSIPSSMYKIYDPETDQCIKARVSIGEARALDALGTQGLSKYKHSMKLDPGHNDEENNDEFYLDDFTFYTMAKSHQYRLCALHDLFKIGYNTLYFNGWISRGNVKSRFYLESVPFQRCSIGNYNLEAPSVDGAVWIQSKQQGRKKAGVWYKLRNPSFEYERFYRPFLWLADLAKHVISFIEDKVSKGNKPSEIGIHSFRTDFAAWVNYIHGTSPTFKAWLNQHPSLDFRSDVAVHAEFLWKEANGILNPNVCQGLRLFKEVLTLHQYRKHEAKDNMTVVSPYVYDLFRHMECAHLLKKVTPVGMEMVVQFQRTHFGHALLDRDNLIANIRVGDVISRKPDGTGSKWKGDKTTRWFGLVQQIVEPAQGKTQGETRFHIKWLYSPCDTPCNLGQYPWPNELFLSSNHCSCHSREDEPFLASEVLAKHSVAWFGDEKSTEEFFVRQSYDNEEHRWVALQKSHIFCDNKIKQSTKYGVGETVFASGNTNRLEPCVIIGFSKDLEMVDVRRLLRRVELDPASCAPPNELVYTEEILRLSAKDVRGSCTVRIFTGNPQVIPTPYDRRGTGNCFFIRFRLQNGTCLADMAEVPSGFRQGFLPQEQTNRKPLRGLDLFAGCGNLGRGIEESGAIEVKWVNDIWSPAIHTYMANAQDQDAVKPFLGSVDILLEKALKGDSSVPSPGEVEFISGGSPCQGFSLLTVDKSHDSQKKNRSLIASFASFVDFYRPKFGLLENVVNMVNSDVGPDNDYLSQLFCALVGMGYQVQVILGDAWAYGAPQQRSRIFLSFARSDCVLPREPARSHSNPVDTPTRAIGYLSNGERFVERQFTRTAFEYVSSGQAIDDLPRIGDGRQVCVPFADHYPNNESLTALTRIAHIPVTPYGNGFVQAYQSGQITKAERKLFPADTLRAERTRSGRGWSRLRPNKLFPTITTAPNHTDSRTGYQIHSREQRTLTLMEIRRAQGVPDNDVLIGSFRERWKLVGNSVARQAALALGLELRKAYYGTLYEDDEDVEVATAATEPKQPQITSAMMINGTIKTGSYGLSAAVAMTPGGARPLAQVCTNGVRATATVTINLTTAADAPASTAVDLTTEDDVSDVQSTSSRQWKRKLDNTLMDSDEGSDGTHSNRGSLGKISKMYHLSRIRSQIA